MPQLPIRVRASSIPATAAAAARLILQWAVAFALGKGWIAADDVQGIVALGAALIAMVWGVEKTRSRHRKLVTAAEAAPNSVAKVTP